MVIFMWDLVIRAFLFILPAYIANSSAALFGGRTPLDLGKNMKDNRRVFGDGKTFQGLFAALFFGTVAGYMIGTFVQGTEFAIGNIEFYTLLGFIMSLGAMVGDITASFIKRRRGIKRGHPVIGLDQLDFLIVAMIFGSVMYFPGWPEVILLLIVTPIIHLFLNYLGYKLRCKSVPW
jgi:CDP-2,3-bis-(O-geranylgeranyl)-sn-glycerol synthase